MRTIDQAETQIGVVEATGKNDGIPAERYNHGECLPWCAAFILWANEHQSEDVLICKSVKLQYELRAVTSLVAHCKTRRWWLPSSAIPQRGDLVFFKERGWSDPEPVGHHVGLVSGYSNGNLYTVEGNMGNAVRCGHYPLTEPATFARIWGYARLPTVAPEGT